MNEAEYESQIPVNAYKNNRIISNSSLIAVKLEYQHHLHVILVFQERLDFNGIIAYCA